MMRNAGKWPAICMGCTVICALVQAGWGQPSPGSVPNKPAATKAQEPLVVPAGRVYEGDLSVTQRKVEIRGTLRGNLLALDSSVLLARGSHVTGDVLCIGSPLTREAGSRVDGRVRELQMPSTWTGTYQVGTLLVPSPSEARPRASGRAADMVRGQIVVTLLGLVGLLIALVIAPRATRIAAEALANQPGRSLVLGVPALLLLGGIEAINAVLLHIVVWIPVGVVVLAAGGVLLVYSGLLGMVFVGGHVLRAMGRGEAGIFGRGALALILLGILNCLPVAQVFSILLELLLFVLGAGALVVTGLGHDPLWLDRRRGGVKAPPDAAEETSRPDSPGTGS